jgi:hypothetical protein
VNNAASKAADGQNQNAGQRGQQVVPRSAPSSSPFGWRQGNSRAIGQSQGRRTGFGPARSCKQ